MRLRHRGIGGLVVEQAGAFAHDRIGIGPDQLRGSRRDALGPFGGLAHHQHRLAERGRLFLHPAAIGQHQVRDIEQAGEMRIVERFDQRDIVEPGQLGIHDLAHIGIEVDRKNNRNVIA